MGGLQSYLVLKPGVRSNSPKSVIDAPLALAVACSSTSDGFNSEVPPVLNLMISCVDVISGNGADVEAQRAPLGSREAKAAPIAVASRIVNMFDPWLSTQIWTICATGCNSSAEANLEAAAIGTHG